jgi:hypothetical protein
MSCLCAFVWSLWNKYPVTVTVTVCASDTFTLLVLYMRSTAAGRPAQRLTQWLCDLVTLWFSHSVTVMVTECDSVTQSLILFYLSLSDSVTLWLSHSVTQSLCDSVTLWLKLSDSSSVTHCSVTQSLCDSEWRLINKPLSSSRIKQVWPANKQAKVWTANEQAAAVKKLYFLKFDQQCLQQSHGWSSFIRNNVLWYDKVSNNSGYSFPTYRVSGYSANREPGDITDLTPKFRKHVTRIPRNTRFSRAKDVTVEQTRCGMLNYSTWTEYIIVPKPGVRLPDQRTSGYPDD